MAQNAIVKGDELMLFQNDKSLAYATSHTFSLTGNTIDISSKDNGYWGSTEIGNISWEITSENLYTNEDYATLFDLMIARAPITVCFGTPANYDINGIVGTERERWELDKTSTGSIYYSGKAYITSLTANANNGENATYSVTLTGAGSITKTVKSA